MNKSTYIANQIRDKILNTQELTPNQALKTEVELCKEYNVSKMTLKKAIDILVDEGLVYKQRGVGTFVKNLTESPLNNIRDRYKDQNLTGFSASHKGLDVHTQVLEYTIIPASDFISEQLGIDPSDFVYYIKRLRFLDGAPNVLEETYMPLDLIPGLKLAHAETSIYSYIENTLQLKVASSHISICAKKSSKEIAGYLDLEPGEPIVAVTQTAFLSNGQLFEYSTCYHRYDVYEFHTVIVKKD